MAPDLEMDIDAVYTMLPRARLSVFAFFSSCTFLVQFHSNNRSECAYYHMAGLEPGPPQDTNMSE